MDVCKISSSYLVVGLGDYSVVAPCTPEPSSGIKYMDDVPAEM